MKKMNLKQFIAALKAVDKKWLHLNAMGFYLGIRSDDDIGCCPITSLTNQTPAWAHDAAKKLGISDALLYPIIKAADFGCTLSTFSADSTHDKSNLLELRKLLLDACGLK